MILRKYVYNYPNFYFFKKFGQISMAYAYVWGTGLCGLIHMRSAVLGVSNRHGVYYESPGI